MLFDSYFIVAIFVLLDSVAGVAIGAACGGLVSLAFKGHGSKVWQDSILGMLGFHGGIIGTALMPWHRNTITEQLDGGGTMITTINSYQHPYRIAVILAILLPVLYEAYRLHRTRNDEFTTKA